MEHNRQDVSFCSKMERSVFVFKIFLPLSHTNEKAVDFYAVDLYLFILLFFIHITFTQFFLSCHG